nr:hypothetical protein [uncultured Desulfuromonas sp.]
MQRAPHQIKNQSLDETFFGNLLALCPGAVEVFAPTQLQPELGNILTCDGDQFFVVGASPGPRKPGIAKRDALVATTTMKIYRGDCKDPVATCRAHHHEFTNDQLSNLISSHVQPSTPLGGQITLRDDLAETLDRLQNSDSPADIALSQGISAWIEIHDSRHRFTVQAGTDLAVNDIIATDAKEHFEVLQIDRASRPGLWFLTARQIEKPGFVEKLFSRPKTKASDR